MVKAAGRRVGYGDVDELAELVAIRDDLDLSIAHAVAGLRASGHTWADIGGELGVTRQAALMRWGSLVSEILQELERDTQSSTKGG